MTIIERFQGKIPHDLESLKTLPGVGKATAGAICVYAFNKPEVFLETNIRTVFIYFFFANRLKIRDAEIEDLIKKTLKRKSPREWYYALMDYGAMLKKTQGNLSRSSITYRKQAPFHGSRRQMRGFLIRLLAQRGQVRMSEAAKKIGGRTSLKSVVAALTTEGFITNERGVLSLSN